MEETLNKILKKLDGLDELRNKMDTIEGKLDENIGKTKALLHQSEVQKAEINSITHSTARIEGEVKNVRSDLRIIEAVTAKNWNDILELKQAK